MILRLFFWVGGFYETEVLVHWFLLIGIGAVLFFCWEKCCVDTIGFPSFQLFI